MRKVLKKISKKMNFHKKNRKKFSRLFVVSILKLEMSQNEVTQKKIKKESGDDDLMMIIIVDCGLFIQIVYGTNERLSGESFSEEK